MLAAPVVLPPLARDIALLSGGGLNTDEPRWKHYTREYFTGTLDSFLQSQWEAPRYDPMGLPEPTFEEIFGPYESPFPPARTNEDQLARDLGPTALVIPALFTRNPSTLIRRGSRADDVARTVSHHSDPKFLGGAPNQTLTRLFEETHKNLHRDLNNFLRKIVDGFGNHMRPQRGNSGQVIRQNFARQQRLEALRDFYRGLGAKYKEAASDFFKQHPEL